MPALGNIPQAQMMNQMNNIRPQQMMMPMDQQQQQMNQMVPNQQMNQMAPNQQQQMNQMVPNQQQQHMNQMVPNQPQQMNQQMGINQQQQMGQQMVVNQQQQQQQGMGMNQFNPNANMNVGNPLMQQLGAPNQQQGNNSSSALLSQLNQSQQQAMAGPMNAGMQRARFQGPPGPTAKMTPQQQHQQQQQAAQQQQQLLNQQLLMQRKQQGEMINQGPTTPQFVAGPGVPSPAQQPMSMQSMSSGMPVHNMGAPSPAYVHSPGNVQLVSSPATAARMPGPQQQRGMAGLLPPPSPSMMNMPTPGGGGMLHTPQGAGMGGGDVMMGGRQGMPGNMGVMSSGGNEDQLYLEKVRQLSRFIDPLTRLISRFGDEDSDKLSKMKIMLDILSNPSKRMPMDTLLKCEAVLEKMDFRRVQISGGKNVRLLDLEFYVFKICLG